MQQQPNNYFSPQAANNTTKQQCNQVFQQQSNFTQNSNSSTKQFSDEDLFLPCKYINPYNQQLNSSSSQNKINSVYSQQQSNLDLCHYATDNSQQIQQAASNYSFRDNFCYLQPQASHFETQPQNENFNPQIQSSNFELQPQDVNFLQQPQNLSFEQPPNSNFLSQSQSSSYEQSQNSNILQQPINTSFGQQSQDANFGQQSQNLSFEQQSQNANFGQQSQNLSFEQQSQNASFEQQPLNASFEQQSQNASFEQQPLNASFEQQSQNTNFEQQPQNTSFCQQPLNSSFEQQSQNTSFEQKQQCLYNSPNVQSFSESESFHISYNNNEFIVNPFCLCKSSLLFDKLIHPFIKDFEQMKSIHLEIFGNKFSNRNMTNFLLLCQNQPTDIQDNEIKEICEIAKMFKAEDIYYTGLDFIRRSIDHNFYVPDNKYDGSDGITYLKIVRENTNEIDEKNKAEDQINKEEVGNGDIATKTEKVDTSKPLVYSLLIELPLLKCPLFRFLYNEKTLFTAKKRDNEVFIAKGDEVHISKKEDHVAYIKQNEASKNNTVSINNMKFTVNYKFFREAFWIDASFPFKNGIEHLTPVKPKYDKKNKKYIFDLSGAYHHKSIDSIRNVVLQSGNGNKNFIVRKVLKYTFEIECDQELDPLIAFTIAISEIIGPYGIYLEKSESKNNSYLNYYCFY